MHFGYLGVIIIFAAERAARKYLKKQKNKKFFKKGIDSLIETVYDTKVVAGKNKTDKTTKRLL